MKRVVHLVPLCGSRRGIALGFDATIRRIQHGMRLGRQVRMPRPPRVFPPGVLLHITQRANGGATIFHKHGDYVAFIMVLAQAVLKFEIRLVAYCVMPNHWHLVLWPTDPAQVSTFMHWLTSTHVRRYQRHYNIVGSGHLYQSRFRCALIDTDAYFYNAIRYVESNALQARMVARAELWPWSSLVTREAPNGDPMMSDWPMPKLDGWLEIVNSAIPQDVDPWGSGGSS
jgi:putative transposase